MTLLVRASWRRALRSTDHPSSVPLSVARVALGLFFAASGWNKTTTPDGRQAMVETIRSIGAPVPELTASVVAGCELAFGLLLAVGLGTRLAATVLTAIVSVALVTVALHQLAPGDPVTWYSNLLYLPETLYLLAMLVFVGLGGGPIGLDRLALARLDGVALEGAGDGAARPAGPPAARSGARPAGARGR